MKISTKFWLILGIVTALYCTYRGFTDGFKQWAFMYVFSTLAIIMFFSKRMMLKRYKNQMHIPEDQRKAK